MKPTQRDSAFAPRKLYLLSGALLLAALLALVIDIPVADFCLRRRLPGEVTRFLGLIEVFAHGYGIAVIALVAFVLDQANRSRLARVLVCAYFAGFVNGLVKTSVGRLRPNEFGFGDPVVLPNHAADTFIGLFPAFTSLSLVADRSIQSFPSGHTATAFGFAIGLSWLYPRGRMLFLGLATLAALQRVDIGAHFVSDVLAGAAIGCLVAGRCLDSGAMLGRWFDRLENLIDNEIAEPHEQGSPDEMEQAA